MTGTPDDGGQARLVRLLDGLEAETTGYVTVDDLAARGVAAADIRQAVEEQLLLVDDRHRMNAARDALEAVTLCRLNRHHPLVRELASD